MEQHNIPLNQGIHLTPSAAEDGQLGDCINLIPKDGSLRNVPQLEPVMSKTQPSSQIEIADGYTLAHVHRPNVDTDNYIVSKKTTTQGHTETSLWLNPVESGDTAILTLNTDETIKQITSVGNTIIVLASDGMHYLLWKNDPNDEDSFMYEDLGTHLPEMLMTFNLIPELTDATKHRQNIDPDFNPNTFSHTEEVDTEHNIFKAHNTIGFEEGYRQPFENSIFGEVNKLINEEVTEKGLFAHPFYVRYAYRLYDGSLVMHSAPIYMDSGFGITIETEHENGIPVPNETDVYDYWGEYGNLDIHVVHRRNSDQTGDDPELELVTDWYFTVKRCKLEYSFVNSQEITDIQNWSDIIKSVEIFISQPFYLYDQGGKIERVRHEILEDATNHKQWVAVDLPKVEHQEELINDCGQFYFVKSIDVNEMDTSTHDLDVKGYLEALTSREQMTDDYDSHDSLIPQYAFPYNQRLNIANITKGLFSGFNANEFCLPDGIDKIRMSVTYHTPQKDISFLLDEISGISLPSIWHYYIPSQYPVTLKIVATTNGNPVKQQVELTSHRFLNGYYSAIARGGFSNPDSKTYAQLVAELPTTSQDIAISLPNKIYTSEINNPFFFPVSGINTVGVGEIKGICAAVKALSTGQFGQFPLYVFTTDGIWALEVASDGTYSVKQPVTRDVVSNDNSITQTDTAVLYVTKRGLHIIYGSETKILTEALEAHTEDSLFTTTSEQGKINIDTTTAGFPEITSSVLATVSLLSQLQTCSISYDGINHIAHIYPAPSQTQPSTHHILHLDSMEWTRTTQPIPSTFIDGYPNATLQIGQKLYQYALPSYNNSILHQGFLLTRETALGSPTTHKILKDMRTLKHWYSAASSNHKVRIIPLISNDRLHWYRLTSLHAHSAIWYRFAIFTLMADSDMLEALTLITEDRRTNKLR